MNAKEKRSTRTELFPLFLKLQGRLCVVVGAGRVAESKIESLLRCGAQVRIVAPEATAAIQEAAKCGAIVWHRRQFQSRDLRGAFLMVAATSSPKLHKRIYRQARRAGIFCNVVDDPQHCDFYYPAVVRRGPLQIAISTSGKSPSLAARLRRQLEQHFPAAYGGWVEEIGKLRAELLAAPIPARRRRAKLLTLSSARGFRNFRKKTGGSAGIARASLKASLRRSSK